MLIVKVENGKIDGALKVLKRKVKNTKQNEILFELKEFEKKSVKKRTQKKKAIYKSKKHNEENQ